MRVGGACVCSNHQETGDRRQETGIIIPVLTLPFLLEMNSFCICCQPATAHTPHHTISDIMPRILRILLRPSFIGSYRARIAASQYYHIIATEQRRIMYIKNKANQHEHEHEQELEQEHELELDQIPITQVRTRKRPCMVSRLMHQRRKLPFGFLRSPITGKW